MERVWQSLWDRYGARYSWAVFGASLAIVLPIVLLTEHTVEALGRAPMELVDRGAHALKGKASSTRVFALGSPS